MLLCNNNKALYGNTYTSGVHNIINDKKAMLSFIPPHKTNQTEMWIAQEVSAKKSKE
jgi:hypothetical protein